MDGVHEISQALHADAYISPCIHPSDDKDTPVNGEARLGVLHKASACSLPIPLSQHFVCIVEQYESLDTNGSPVVFWVLHVDQTVKFYVM